MSFMLTLSLYQTFHPFTQPIRELETHDKEDEDEGENEVEHNFWTLRI